ncbi:unnamed protein product, partial [Adineta steineri]
MSESDHRSMSTTSKSSYHKINWKDMEWYDNVFDILDRNNDVLEYTKEELNRYFTSGHLNVTIDEEAAEQEEEDDIIDDDDNLFIYNSVESTEEEVLSQQFSQLSTENESEEGGSSVVSSKRKLNTTSAPYVVFKRIKSANDNDPNVTEGEEEEEQDQIPAYLLTTNKSFDHMIQKVMNTASSIDMNDLRQLALLIHHIAALNIQKQVTIVYLRSGIGKLRESEPSLTEVDRRVWPMQVTSALAEKRKQGKIATTVQISTEDEHRDHENLVNERLQQINERIEQYQRQFNEKKNQLIGLTSTIEEAIVKYVQHYGVIPLQMKRDMKIALLEYDYDAEILERKYLEEKPNDYQIEVAKRLYQAKYEFEKSKRELLELKQRVFYNKPLSICKSVQTSLQISNDTVTTAMIKQLDLIALQIIKAEVKFYLLEKKFDAEYGKMLENHRNLVKNKGISTTLNNIIDQRLTNIVDRWRTIYDYRINFYLRSSYGDLENMNHDKNNDTTEQSSIKNIESFSNLINHTKYQLNSKQIQLLNRGPTYTPPCQMSLFSSSTSSQSLNDIVKKQFAPLKHQMASVLSKHHINIALSWEVQNTINQKFVDYFSTSIPLNIRQRTVYEMDLVQSIRLFLKKNNLILRRTADNQNTFYLGETKVFDAVANEYLLKSDAYNVLRTIVKEEDKQEWQNDLNARIEAMNDALQILKRRKALDKNVVDTLITDLNKVKLPYLYFLPDVSKQNELSLIPKIVAQHSITSKISKYVHRLLRSFVDEKMKSLTFRDEVDFMQKLYYYTYNQQRLKPTTLFCRIKITNFYTLNEHEKMIDTVTYFLQDNSVTNKVNQVSIMTIKNLLQLFIFNNLFCYENKIYTIMKGSPNTMALSDTLANIYLFDWQKLILKEVQQKDEFFGRYKDEIFFTWNDSDHVLRTYLHAVQNVQSNVHFQVSIGSSVRFFGAHVENRQGQLYTRVHPDLFMQNYTLPYVVGHTKLKHSNYLRAALLRAICYCSLVEDFHRERIYLELSYLINGYSLLFVESHVQNFFNYFRLDNMRYRSDQTIYHSFRRQWFDLLGTQHTLSDQLQQFDDHGNVIRFHYLYDYGPRCQFNQQFHELWSKYFCHHP